MLILSGLGSKRGTPVRFEFPSFRGRGEVIWMKEAEDEFNLTVLLGIKFHPLRRSARKELSGLLDARDN